MVTYLVYKATKGVAKATKEIGKLSMMPRVIIIDHNKLGDDQEHDHYEFILRNNGKDNAFEVQIEIFHKNGSTVPQIIPMIAVNGGDRVTNKSVSKGAISINYKINYRDYADNLYTKEYSYNFKDKCSYRTDKS